MCVCNMRVNFFIDVEKQENALTLTNIIRQVPMNRPGPSELGQSCLLNTS